MRSLVCVCLVLLCALPVAAQDIAPVTFTKQIRQFLMQGDDTVKVDMTVTFTAATVTFVPIKKADPIDVPYTAMTSLVYDRRSRVRKLFGPRTGKAEDHFLTIQYKTSTGRGEYIEVEMGKDTAPRMIATMEARSGIKIERASGS